LGDRAGRLGWLGQFITFWLCEAAQFNPLVTAALVGISGHMGSQAIYQLERWAQKRLGATAERERP
jgi:hypothetical protein